MVRSSVHTWMLDSLLQEATDLLPLQERLSSFQQVEILVSLGDSLAASVRSPGTEPCTVQVAY